MIGFFRFFNLFTSEFQQRNNWINFLICKRKTSEISNMQAAELDRHADEPIGFSTRAYALYVHVLSLLSNFKNQQFKLTAAGSGEVSEVDKILIEVLLFFALAHQR